MTMLLLSWGGTLLVVLSASLTCLFSRRTHQAETDKKVAKLRATADRASAAANGSHPARGGVPLPGWSPATAAAVSAELRRNSLRTPLLSSIPEDNLDASPELPVQQLEELPMVVQRFLAKSIRDGRPFK